MFRQHQPAFFLKNNIDPFLNNQIWSFCFSLYVLWSGLIINSTKKMTKIIRISLNSYPTKYNLSSCVIGGAFQGGGRGDLCKTCANPGRLIVVMIVVTLIVSSLYCSLEAFSRLQKKKTRRKTPPKS